MTEQDKLDYITAKLDQVHLILTGNGDPCKGLVVRVDRMEQNSAMARWFLGVVIVALVGLFIGQIQLTKIDRETPRTDTDAR